ncbi:MAG TPA: hypothetical protein VIU61_22900 [Kofleriaceae bacterium]
MRPAPILGLLAVCGCNQIFGLDKTAVRDGATTDAAVARAHLRWLVATTDRELIPKPLQRVPIDPPPEVQIGPVGGALSPVELEPDGSVVYEVTPDKWRFVYTLGDSIPHEVQWNPGSGGGELVVPLFGRHDRVVPPPANSGYRLDPTSPPSNGTPIRVFSVGLWTQGPNYLYAGPRDYAYAGMSSLSGVLGTPELAQGDAVVIQGTTNDSGCSVVSGAAHGQADLVAGTFSSIALFWKNTRDTFVQVSHEPLVDIEQRVQTALGSRAGTILPTRFEHGRIPSQGMPGFTQPPSAQFVMPNPLLLPLVNCDFSVLTTPSFVERGEQGSLPRALHSQVVSSRTPVDGPGLASGVQELVHTPGDAMGPFALAFNIKLAIAPITLGTYDLADAPDDGPITITQPTTLSFALSSPPNGVADYFDVTVFRLDGESLVPIRIYTVTEPTAVIDPQDFSTGLRYVLQIRSYGGYPDADTGDFGTIVQPLTAGSIFTRTFIIN